MAWKTVGLGVGLDASFSGMEEEQHVSSGCSKLVKSNVSLSEHVLTGISAGCGCWLELISSVDGWVVMVVVGPSVIS